MAETLAQTPEAVLYRKWRPRAFAELFGQEHVARTLTNALASGRIAHAYLFAGPRGTGKTTTGRLLAKALNCEEREADGEPCNRCPSCLAYLAGRAMDLIELDAASNRGIEEIRSLRDKVAFAPAAGAYKVYLIDEVHMLTEPAFNALLKTLEEPPPHAVFVLATTEAHKLPATVTSRCQRFDFRRPSLSAMVRNLERICAGEGIACEPEALELIARSATGSHRDAVGLLDQLATSYGKDLTLEHVRAGLGLIGDERAGRLARLAIAPPADTPRALAEGLSLIASVRDDGLDLRQFQRELVEELRALLLAKAGLGAAEAATPLSGVPVARVYAALRAFGEADLKSDPNSTLPLDIAFAECVLSQEPTAARAPQGRRAAETGPPRGEAPAVRPRAPQPLPAAARAEPPANGGVAPPSPALEAARGRLRSIYEVARAREVHVGALLNGPCDIIEADEAALTFGFKFPMHAQKIQEPQNLKVLTEAVSEVLGRPVEVRCRHDASVESWKLREGPGRSALVRAAQQMGARVLAPEPEPGDEP